MLVLSNLRPLRLHHELPRAALASVTRISHARLKDIELRKAEPWWDEALAIARAMGCSVHELLSSRDVTNLDLDPRFHAADLRFWEQGLRLPLSLALRLQVRFGLPSVEDLEPTMLMRQIWDIVEASERHPEAPGWCPWCQADRVAGELHRDDCLPHNIIGSRRVLDVADTPEGPRPARGGQRSGSAKVRGLRAIRERAGLKQSEMAEQLEFNVNHYARVERGELPLTLAKAEQVTRLFGATREEIFSGIVPAQ